MKKYEVVVNRTGFSSHTFEVEADNLADAEKLGMQAAWNHSFSEHDADYEVECILPMKVKNDKPKRKTRTRRDNP